MHYNRDSIKTKHARKYTSRLVLPQSKEKDFADISNVEKWEQRIDQYDDSASAPQKPPIKHCSLTMAFNLHPAPNLPIVPGEAIQQLYYTPLSNTTAASCASSMATPSPQLTSACTNHASSATSPKDVHPLPELLMGTASMDKPSEEPVQKGKRELLVICKSTPIIAEVVQEDVGNQDQCVAQASTLQQQSRHLEELSSTQKMLHCDYSEPAHIPNQGTEDQNSIPVLPQLQEQEKGPLNAHEIAISTPSSPMATQEPMATIPMAIQDKKQWMYMMLQDSNRTSCQ